MEASDAVLASVVRSSLESIIIIDSTGAVVEFNPTAEATFGYAREEAIGRQVGELIVPPALRDAHHAGFARYLATGEARLLGRRIEITAVRADGQEFPVELAITEVQAEGQRLFTASLRDLSQQRQTEAELERSREALYQSEKMTALGSLLAGVSHELNNPLAIVVGEAIMLEEEAEGTDLADSAARIKRAAERCSRIVQTFLAMARQKKPERTLIEANELVHDALALAEYSLRTAGIRVTTELASGLPRALGDPDQLHQVVLNLVLNAQQALEVVPVPRELLIRTRSGSAGRSIVIEVSDNGPGVSAEVARRIFEPFYTTKPLGIGTGLGLSYSLGVVEAHGGTLLLLDTSGGTTFRVELPAEEAASEPAEGEQAPDETAVPAKGKALVIDDEADLANTLARFLHRFGYATEVAVGGAAGIERLREGDYDIVLSDLRMPDVDGPALHAWIEAERPELLGRLAFVTGDTLGSMAGTFLEAASRPFIEKPFTRESVRELLEKLTSG